jgi:hypothetical protein
VGSTPQVAPSPLQSVTAAKPRLVKE